MSPYVDYSYYEDEYLFGRDPLIKEDEDFQFFERKAQVEVDNATLGRIRKLSEIPEAVKNCICEITEVMYKADKLDAQSYESGGGGPLASYSNDGQSGTFDVSHSAYTADGIRTETNRIIRSYLVGTGLLFRGVVEYES